MFTTAGWWGQFWANLAANLIVALAVGIFVAQYLGIRAERQRRHELREKSVELILNELRTNRKELGRLEEYWSKGELAPSYLETEAWRLACQNQLLQGLDANVASLLVKAYVAVGHLAKRSRMLFDFLLAGENHVYGSIEVNELFEPLVRAARDCSKKLDRAIEALDSHFADW